MKRRSARTRTHVLWCSNQRTQRSNGWAFPPNVEKHLRKLTAGSRVCHLFGGFARWGLRIDIDPLTRPDVRADAWLPPFVENAFDYVILDPPYMGINQQMKQHLLRGAAFIAKKGVIWFHTQWVAGDKGMTLRRAWLVRVGDSCSVWCILVFNVPKGPKAKPRNHFTRGPALKYNRWLRGELRLPFDAPKEIPDGEKHGPWFSDSGARQVAGAGGRRTLP